jgi:hypothetical protein
MKASEKIALGLGAAWVALQGTIMWSLWDNCRWAQRKGVVEPLIGDKKVCHMPKCFRTTVAKLILGPAFACPEHGMAYINDDDLPLGVLFHEEGHLVWPAAKPPLGGNYRDHYSKKGVRYERQADRYAIDKLMSNPSWGMNEVVKMYDFLSRYNIRGTDMQYRLDLIKRYMRMKYRVEIS